VLIFYLDLSRLANEAETVAKPVNKHAKVLFYSQVCSFYRPDIKNKLDNIYKLVMHL